MSFHNSVIILGYSPIMFGQTKKFEHIPEGFFHLLHKLNLS